MFCTTCQNCEEEACPHGRFLQSREALLVGLHRDDMSNTMLDALQCVQIMANTGTNVNDQSLAIRRCAAGDALEEMPLVVA